ncbi:1-acyl-sn-glycerol-3-phosphate acyltransferase [Kocuria varians]|uniref:1-acyl-sn-glycerol-3-phosphate acyltransferase n=1 Tax=Kocuria varians TaxID=1272 RepID=A0A4Y4D5C5_KOCVA|nr:lysophospholipid acyltransferase family protein [Kocuria varians]GEC99796.1 1-acyl-sn-glycerol-3-phosphate acyltransferase [Kocuria varians]
MSRTSQRSAFRLLAGMILPVYRSLTVPHWRGQENFPAEGGFVAVANHLTEIDPITVAYPLYKAGIMPRFLAKESLFRVPVMGTIITRIGQVPVYRGTSRAKDSLRAARAELDSGGAIIVYPEGTITRDPGMWPMRGRTGAARLALEASVPVVPMAHWGDQEVLYRDPEGHRTFSAWPRKTVDGIIGEPLTPEDLVPGGLQRPGHPSAEELAHATEVVMAAVSHLLGQLRGETPPEQLFDPRAPRTGEAGTVGNAGGSVAP